MFCFFLLKQRCIPSRDCYVRWYRHYKWLGCSESLFTYPAVKVEFYIDESMTYRYDQDQKIWSYWLKSMYFTIISGVLRKIILIFFEKNGEGVNYWVPPLVLAKNGRSTSGKVWLIMQYTCRPLPPDRDLGGSDFSEFFSGIFLVRSSNFARI